MQTHTTGACGVCMYNSASRGAVSRLLGFAAGAWLFWTLGVTDTPNTSPAPTFSRDVWPVLRQHCIHCHRPGQIAPMSLMTYADARPYAKAMREMTSTR